MVHSNLSYRCYILPVIAAVTYFVLHLPPVYALLTTHIVSYYYRTIVVGLLILISVFISCRIMDIVCCNNCHYHTCDLYNENTHSDNQNTITIKQNDINALPNDTNSNNANPNDTNSNNANSNNANSNHTNSKCTNPKDTNPNDTNPNDTNDKNSNEIYKKEDNKHDSTQTVIYENSITHDNKTNTALIQNLYDDTHILITTNIMKEKCEHIIEEKENCKNDNGPAKNYEITAKNLHIAVNNDHDLECKNCNVVCDTYCDNTTLLIEIICDDYENIIFISNT